MSVWGKLVTALRGGAHEMGEAVVDTQALRILDQEVRDADAELRKSKEALADIMAKRKLAAERVEKIDAKVSEYEQYALKALEAGNEELAKEVAGKIANLETSLASEREVADGYAVSVAQLRRAVSQAESTVKRLKQQIDTVKATESVQKAQMAVALRYGGSQAKLHTAIESLDRIKKRQAERAAKMEATAELAQADRQEDMLEIKLRAAGIVPDRRSAESVLERLKNKAKAG